MPWAIVIRLLARLAASLFFWRIATSRRRAFAGGQAVPGATPKTRIDAQAAVMALRTSILLTWRALLTAAFLAATAVLGVAGVTIVVLTPRWLGTDAGATSACGRRLHPELIRLRGGAEGSAAPLFSLGRERRLPLARRRPSSIR
jgi:hypothetical protein